MIVIFNKIGYGEILPTNRTEVIFNFVFLFMALCSFALLSGKMQSIAEQGKVAEAKKEENEKHLE